MASLWVVFCLIAIGFSTVIANQDGVPALFWTNAESDFPTPLAGHTTQKDEFKDDYLQNNVRKSGHTLVAFIQDKLSLEDIIDNADVYNEHSTGSMFSNLKRLVETHTSVHLPAVVSPGQTLEELARDFKGKVHTLVAPYNIKHVTINPAVPNMVLVHLPHNDGKSFGKIDAIIGSLTDDLKSLNVPFTAVYTGMKPSQLREDAGYTGRHLLENVEDKSSNTSYKYYQFDSCLLAYKYMQLRICKSKATDKQTMGCDAKRTFNITSVANANETRCGNGTDGKIVLIFNKQEDLHSLKVEFIFGYNKYKFWNATIQITYNIAGNGSMELHDNTTMATDTVIYAPKYFSYHCHTPYPFKQKNITSDHVVTLGISDLQIQYGPRRKLDKFDRPNDCESFFSIPVLSGLFVSLLLISILTFGICMILNISTMDRFDDPKGKTISVNTAEG